MTFPARYPGRCRDCGETIHVGDHIAVTDHGVRCAECDGGIDAPSRHQQDPPVCPVCWLTHPKGACDRG